MDKQQAETLVKEIVSLVESNGVDHYSSTCERKGNQEYIELKVSIKIK